MTAPAIVTDDAVLEGLLALRQASGLPGWKCLHTNGATLTVSMRLPTPADVDRWRTAMGSRCEIVLEPKPQLTFHYAEVTDWRVGWTVYMTAVVDLFPDAAANVASAVPAGAWGEWAS